MISSTIQKIIFVLVLLSFSIFSNGQYSIFFAIWIFTTILLFGVRKLSRWKGFLLAFSSIGISYYIGFDVVPFLPISISVIITIVFSVFASLPYLIDSFFIKNRASFLSTLIFPCSVVLLEYIYHLINQYGTWGHYAYSQHSQHLLLQSISVFGMGYITFLINWFASVINWIYEERNELNKIKNGILIYSLIIGITLLYGGYRTQFQKTDIKTVRVASISALDSLAVSFDIGGLKNKSTENEIRIEANKQTKKIKSIFV